MQETARGSLYWAMRYWWRNPSHPLIAGRHTIEVADRITRAMIDFEAGKSTYLVITIPYRHGKSDLSSRFFPAWALGRCPDTEIMIGSYGAELSEGFSRDVAGIVRDERYRAVFPGVEFSTTSNSASKREVEGRQGKLYAMGLGGAATGRGAGILILDDCIKNRAEAESETIRQSRWDSFINDFMSRLAPVHIVLVVATRWHVDDVIGRIIVERDRNPQFPQFEVIHYRAREVNEDGTFRYLHEERYSLEWYEAQFATQGDYGAASLLQGEPTVRGGNMLKTGGIQVVDELPAGLHWCRFWDLASTEKERAKDNPDWTVGAKCAVTGSPETGYALYIADLQTCQSEAPARNRMIVRTATADGGACWQGVESVAGYKDAATTLADVLRGVSVVRKINVSKDKVARAGEMEPVFDAGRVFVQRAAWNGPAIQQLSEFPSSAHDDIVDAIAGGFAMARDRLGGLSGIGAALGRGAV